jgi:hypothetical protein
MLFTATCNCKALRGSLISKLLKHCIVFQEDASDSNQEDATDSNQEGESDSNLGGIVAGIAVPAVLIIIILGLLLAYYRWKLRKETESGENEPDMPMKSDFFLPESSV